MFVKSWLIIGKNVTGYQNAARREKCVPTVLALVFSFFALHETKRARECNNGKRNKGRKEKIPP